MDRIAELEIRARNNTDKSFDEVTKSLRQLQAALLDQQKAAKRGEADMKAYGVTLAGIKAAADLKSPVILQVSKGARNYANPTLLRYMAEGAVAFAGTVIDNV